jgi:hypothetical protein
MTSLTCIGNGDQPEIVVNPEFHVSEINPLIYGGFIEYRPHVFTLVTRNRAFVPANKH